jgi:hypothetical protein
MIKREKADKKEINREREREERENKRVRWNLSSYF